MPLTRPDALHVVSPVHDLCQTRTIPSCETFVRGESMVYDAHPLVIEWFETVLTARDPGVRRRAVELLRLVDGPRRSAWIERALRDEDPVVRALAILLEAARWSPGCLPREDLFESDFAAFEQDPWLQWEWEYRFVPCRGLYIPSSSLLVWVRAEDDRSARELALMKATAGLRDQRDLVPVMTHRRFVNRFTRSPRSASEALLWRRQGRHWME